MTRPSGLFSHHAITEIVFGKSLITLRVMVGTSATLLVNNNTYAKAYIMRFVNPAVPVYIGGPEVTQSSGFELDSTVHFIFGMLENTALYAVAPIETEVHILDMGL